MEEPEFEKFYSELENLYSQYRDALSMDCGSYKPKEIAAVLDERFIDPRELECINVSCSKDPYDADTGAMMFYNCYGFSIVHKPSGIELFGSDTCFPSNFNGVHVWGEKYSVDKIYEFMRWLRKASESARKKGVKARFVKLRDILHPDIVNDIVEASKQYSGCVEEKSRRIKEIKAEVVRLAEEYGLKVVEVRAERDLFMDEEHHYVIFSDGSVYFTGDITTEPYMTYWGEVFDKIRERSIYVAFMLITAFLSKLKEEGRL